MTEPQIQHDPGSHKGRRPCVALMGEFSAGKSTLTNLLIGTPALPVQVTATQLPPVWIRKGDAPPARVDGDGVEHPVALADVAAARIDIDDTRYVRIHHDADLLYYCDLIDMPGISDPNMSPEVWQRVLHHADAIIWCSHATQAWRQSEAAVWETIPPALQERSILLLTRFDKITAPQDRDRVLRRVRREAGGLFSAVFPISLTDALRAGDDRDAWMASGAEDFVEALVDLLHRLGNELGTDFDAPVLADAPQEPSQTGFAASLRNRQQAEAAAQAAQVMPRRVAPRGTPRRPRLPRGGEATPRQV